MRTKTLWDRKSLLLLLLPLAFLSFKVVVFFQPGLDSVESITPFMNGNLPSSKPSDDIDLVEIHTDIPWESPQAILPFPGTDKLLVVEMDGRFFTLPDNDNATENERTMVMDIQDRCWYYTYSGNTGQKHGGFQNVVFHPDFGQGMSKDYIYVYYLFKAENEDSDWNPPYYDRLSRFTWTGNNFDPNSELIMINQYDTTKGHDGSGLAFGDDGFLYVSVGDEGTHSAESIPHTQLLNDRFRSGVWRIDVDMQGGSVSHPIERQPNNENTPANVEQSYTQGYYIPNDNPWVTGTGEFLEEFYAIGLRQPFRMTYDPPTGNFWLGDVGASKWEEVNIMDKPGLNFQWNFKEGFEDGFRNSTNMPNPIHGEERVPLYAYDGSVGSAVIGGYVYRGSNIPGLYGKYIFGDNANGSVYALTHTGGNTHGGVEVISNIGGSVFNGISSLGVNHVNEIMVLKLSNGTPGGGKIFKIENNVGSGDDSLPALLSETGVFSDMQNLTPAPGVIPYDVINSLWSSGTDKHRWVAIPQDGNVNSSDEQIGYNEKGAWTFPIGTTFIKHFNNPNGTKLETRLWVHGADGEWFGSSYKWRANGLEADLILLGDNETITIDGDTFNYEYPASNACVQCHNSSAGWVLGFSTRQLNKEIDYPSTGRFSNQLETLGSLGFIPVVDTNTVPTLVSIEDNNQPLETRVRSYFDSNCAYCHLPGNTRAGFDMRFSTPLSEQALIHGAIIEDETGSGKAIVPGDVSASNIHYRMSSLDPSIMMMPLAKGRADTEALQLLEAWINGLNGNCDTENTDLLGSDNLTDGNFLDAHSPHININRTGAYTNNEEVAVSVCLDKFNFYASRVGNPVTPFVAKIEGENDFTVVSIGQTRTSTEYTTGVNIFNFSDHSSDAVVLQPGESIAPGYMDAYPDGSGSFSGNSLIPAMTSGETDDIWQSYEANPDSDPHLVMGFIPQGNSIAQHLNRSYQFNIEINISAVNGELANPVVTLFQHVGYGGTSWELGVGEYPDITFKGISDNDASSVQVEEGYIVELYSEKDFEGDVFILEENDGNLVASDFNDKVSSIKIYAIAEPPGPSVATLFQDGTYGGASWELELGDYGDISLEGIPLNQISSVQVSEGYVVELYPELNFGGASIALTSNTSNLLALGIDNDAESVKVFVAPVGQTVVTLFQHVNYGGTSWELGVGEYPDITVMGITDNDASSLQIEEGYIVELYSEKNFGGDVFILEEHDSNLVASGFNDQVSSVKIYAVEDPPGPAVATLFQDGTYGGTSWELELGNYGDISLKGIPLNQISSVQVSEGYVVELYPELNFGGAPIALTSDTISLVGLGIDDDTESIKIFANTEVACDCQCASGEYSLLVNGSFEETSNPAYATAYDLIEDLGSANNGVKFIDAHTDNDFPGWFTTGGIALQQGGLSQGGTLELGQSGFLGVPASNGNVFVEMDGNHHNQIISVTEGQLLDWELSHQGREGTDVINISAGPVGNQTVIATVSSSNSEWVTHTGKYQVPVGVTEIQFTITPLEASDGDIDSSNLLDFVKVCPSKETITTTVATLFQHVAYGGTSWELGVGEYPDITLEGITDNDASSLQIEEGYVIELYAEKDFGGEVFILEENDFNLVASGFNDQASSVKIYNVDNPSGPSMATLFQDGAYGGTSWKLGIGEYADISLEGITLNDVGSVQVADGYVVELYPDLNFGGTPIALTSDIDDLVALGINNDAESVKVFVAPSGPTVATLFQHGNYNGSSWALGVGEYPDITLQGVTDNDASSLRIEEGYVIELYSEKNFGGGMIVLEEDYPVLGNSGFDDTVSSVKIYSIVDPPGPTMATLFQDGAYGGTSLELEIGDYADISLEGIPLNEVGSVQVADGYVVELYPELNFGGTPIALTSDTSDLVALGINDDTESVKVFVAPAGATVATLFQHVAYGGTSWELGVGEYPDITWAGITDNDASSLQIEEGYVVELYSEKDFGGEVFILEENDSNLFASGFNDQASSVRIYNVVDPPGPTMAILFQDGAYGGTSWELEIGDYSDISLEGVTLNEVGSVQVADGYVVELYPELNFGGTPIALTSNTSDLVALGINDDTESVKVFVYMPEVNPVVTLFQHGNYNGSSWELSVGEYPDITLQGVTDNDASSLKIEEGYVMELYSEKNFGGAMIVLDEDYPVLGNSGFDDTVSSVKIYEYVAPSGPTMATLYQDDQFGGAFWELGVGEYADISLEGVTLNEVGSVQVADGYVVELYPELNFGGTPITLTSDASDLVALGINDDTESVKVFVYVPEFNPVVTLFQHGNYSGSTWELGVGEYPDITLEGIPDNNASGLQIEDGYVIELYSEKDFMGELLKLDENSIFLGNYGFNDKTSSVRIYEFIDASEPTVLTLFLDSNYTGATWELGVGQYPDITLEGIPDNNASGLQIEDGYTVELYSEKDFGGEVLILDENANFLATYDFNDRLSSIKIYESIEGAEPSGVSLKASIGQELPISLYPNPVDDMFYLHSEKIIAERANVYIYSSNGILVKQQKVIFENTIDVEIYVDKLAGGIYTILIVNDIGENTAIQIIKN